MITCFDVYQSCSKVDGCSGHPVSAGLCVPRRTAAAHRRTRAHTLGGHSAQYQLGGGPGARDYPPLLSDEAGQYATRHCRHGDHEVSWYYHSV